MPFSVGQARNDEGGDLSCQINDLNSREHQLGPPIILHQRELTCFTCFDTQILPTVLYIHLQQQYNVGKHYQKVGSLLKCWLFDLFLNHTFCWSSSINMDDIPCNVNIQQVPIRTLLISLYNLVVLTVFFTNIFNGSRYRNCLPTRNLPSKISPHTHTHTGAQGI